MSDPTAIPHVLIVEDEEILLKFLTYHVEHAGYRATPVTSGGEIFSILEREHVDMILMDLGLPDGDGLTWTQQVRERTKVPIVVLTGRQGDDDRIMALGLGADDYLTKPCDPRELLLRIRNILERSGAPTPAPAEAPTAPAPRPAPAPEARGARGGERRGGDRRSDYFDRRRSGGGDRRGGGRPSAAVMALAALFLVAAGGGLTWFLLAPDGAEPPAQAERIGLTPPKKAAGEAAAPVSKTAAPAAKPAPAGDQDTPDQQSLDQHARTVTAAPVQEETDEAPRPPSTEGVATETETDRPLAATSYSWVLKSKCPAIPEVPWWRVRRHTDIVRYVNTRHAGDWQPYIKAWVGRLGKLEDIYARNSGVKTKTGEILKGPALKDYIAKTQQRVDAIMCLSRAAADYAYRRSQMRQ